MSAIRKSGGQDPSQASPIEKNSSFTLDEGSAHAMVKAVGAGLRSARLDRGFKMVEVAQLVNVSQSVLCRIERANRVPNLMMLLRLCAVVGVAPDNLMRQAQQEAFPLGYAPWEFVPGSYSLDPSAQ